MSLSPKFSSKRNGFTLVEIMSSIAVLSIMMLMMGQMLALTSKAWTDGRRHVNNFTKSRAMLDLFASDIQSGVFRSDLPVFPAPTSSQAPGTIEFYTKRPGVPPTGSTARNISLVKYDYGTDTSTSVSMTTLQRGDMPILWTSPATDISFGSSSLSSTGYSKTITARDTAPGVVDFRKLFVYADGTVSTTYPSASGSALRAIALTLGVGDDQTLQKMGTAKVTQLRTALDAAVTTNTRSVKADWESYLNGGTMTWGSYPKEMAVGLKIFERYVTITGF